MSSTPPGDTGWKGAYTKPIRRRLVNWGGTVAIARAGLKDREGDTCWRRSASHLGEYRRNSNTCSATNSSLETDGALDGVNNPDSRSNPTRLLPAMLEALDFLGVGWVVCDVACRILGTNRTADNILRARDGLEIDSNGALCVLHGCSRPLGEAVRQAARARLSGSHDIVLTVHRAPDKRGLRLLMRSVPGVSTTNRSRLSAALVLILDSAPPVKTTHADLYGLYRLTPTEARVATLLMEGETLRHCSLELGISSLTARAHLKRIFKKTRVHRQGELVALLLKSIGMARLGNEAPL